MAAQKVLVIGAGDNVVRLMPPLIVDDTHINQAVDAISAACAAIRADKKAKEGPK